MIYHNSIINAIKSYLLNLESKNDSPKDIKFEEILESVDSIRSKIGPKTNTFNSNLPIDLISYYSYEGKDEADETCIYSSYTIFIIISTDILPEHIQDKILFYKTYLSSIISTIDLKFTVVVNGNIKKDKSLKDWIIENGIGLWYYKKNLSITELKKPLSLRELIEYEFNKERPVNSFQFFDKYIHNTVDSIAGIRPENIGKSYIDRKAIDEVFKIKNLKYKDDLLNLLNLHLTEKGNELEFAEKVFINLWKNHIGYEYKEILKKFESSLQYIFNGYRDHYLHQLQVFLIGLPIIDKYYSKFRKIYENPELVWLVSSSFHDIAYPVQQYDKFGEKFFKTVFNIDRNPGYCEFRLHFVDDDFLICMGHIINNLCERLLHRKLKANWLETEKDLIQLFYRLITVDKNHGVMSSVSLLMLLQKDIKENEPLKKIYEKVIIPASLSIAVHDYGVWSEVFTEKIEKSPEIKFRESVSFEDDPISFLLIYCDSIQEWARPSKSKEVETEKKIFYLKDYLIEKNKVEITLWTPTYSKSQAFFKKKQKELSQVQELLKQPNEIEFSIKLKDSQNLGEDFIMGGKSI
jgi:hypothetical protein